MADLDMTNARLRVIVPTVTATTVQLPSIPTVAVLPVIGLPGPEGGTAKWRVHIDSAVVEPNQDQKNPYKGTIKSSWFADGQKIEANPVRPTLPFELMSNELSQDCWALWDPAGKKWGWE